MTALDQHVSNRGTPPARFLSEVIAWGKAAPLELFEPNQYSDIYSSVKNALGPWAGTFHRRAVMLEVMRVHAGFESSWNWNEGVDTTNETSVENISGQEAGIFQVSFDSELLEHAFLKPFALANDIWTVDKFIARMKLDHPMAMEYYARLIRVNVAWAGPIIRHEIDPWLRRDAVAEFQRQLAI